MDVEPATMDVLQDKQAPRQPAAVTLDDRYARFDGRVFLTGIQALVRLPLLQRRPGRA